jgi:PKD repeat protein
MKRFLLITTLLFTGIVAQAQCMLYPVSLNQRINSATCIVEGKVLNSTSYWNAEKNYIYTLHQVYAYKLFKGVIAGNPRVFYIVTEGGIVGLQRQNVTATLELEPGTTGVFFCTPSNKKFADASAINGYALFEAYAGPQGLVEFDADMQTAHDPFAKYTINPELYNYIIDATGTKPVVFDEYEDTKYPVLNVAPVINSFSPDTVSAGIKDVVTISGTNFGNTRGSGFVAFDNADNGGSTTVQPVNVEYISWTDTEIQVEVTGKAGTGKITVNNGSSNTQSSKNLVVNFAQLNVKDNNSIVYQPQHIGQNGAGYTWQFFTGFYDNSAARQAFLRAFQNWRCGTFINWDIGTNTSTDVIALDGVNVIRFDSAGELTTGVLGRCTSYWSGCTQGSNTSWFVNELDIVFDDGAKWNFGPASPGFSQYDFESVAVHELGHGHQLGHVINSKEIMHYSIANGQTKRTLSSFGDLAGGNYVMSLNLAGGVCGESKMVALSTTTCSLIPVANFATSATTICPGIKVVYTDSSGGSTNSYVWDFGNDASPATATGKGPHNVTYSVSGNKTVQLIVSGVIGNDTITKTNLLNVLNDKPLTPASINGTDTGCLKAQTFTTNKVTNATKYTWGVNGGGTTNNSTDTTTSITFTGAGTAHGVWVKAGNSCGFSDSVVKLVPVIDNPKADFTFTISHDSVFLTNTSTNSIGYTWKFGNNQTSNLQSFVLLPAQSGTFVVKLLASNFCGTDSITQQITFIRDGIGEVVNKIGLLLYPNPTSEKAIVKIDGIASLGTLHFELYDVTGRMVKQTQLTQQETEITNDGLAAGMYLYKVYSNADLLAAGRLIIK